MTAGLVLVLLVLVARYASALGAAGGYLLVAASVAWMVANHPMEGTVLLRLTGSHGVTEGDLAGVVGIVLGVRLARRDLAARRRDHDETPAQGGESPL